MAGPPGTYNDTTIYVDPDNMYHQAAVAIPLCISNIAHSLEKIVNTWNDLKLGWMGTTADQAEDFNRRWQASMRQLFGSPGQKEFGPGEGALPKIASAVAMAAGNFGNAEDAVVSMFNQIPAGGGGGGGSSRDTHTGSIWEDNTPK